MSADRVPDFRALQNTMETLLRAEKLGRTARLDALFLFVLRPAAELRLPQKKRSHGHKVAPPVNPGARASRQKRSFSPNCI